MWYHTRVGLYHIQMFIFGYDPEEREIEVMYYVVMLRRDAEELRLLRDALKDIVEQEKESIEIVEFNK